MNTNRVDFLFYSQRNTFRIRGCAGLTAWAGVLTTGTGLIEKKTNALLFHSIWQSYAEDGWKDVCKFVGYRSAAAFGRNTCQIGGR